MRSPEHEAVVKTLKEFFTKQRRHLKAANICYYRRVFPMEAFHTGMMIAYKRAIKILARNWRNRNKKGVESGRPD